MSFILRNMTGHNPFGDKIVYGYSSLPDVWVFSELDVAFAHILNLPTPDMEDDALYLIEDDGETKELIWAFEGWHYAGVAEGTWKKIVKEEYLPGFSVRVEDALYKMEECGGGCDRIPINTIEDMLRHIESGHKE
jgi:hypothetical protein